MIKINVCDSIICLKNEYTEIRLYIFKSVLLVCSVICKIPGMLYAFEFSLFRMFDHLINMINNK